jgi:hypothetical protein
MLDKYLKIFGLDNNFSLDELEGKYKSLLKEFDTKNIEDDLKIIFLEEQVKIREAYQILLKFNHTREKVSSIKSKGKTLHVKAGAGGEKKKKMAIIMTICALLLLALGLSGVFFEKEIQKLVNPPKVITEIKESIDVDSIVDAVLEEIGIVEEAVKPKPQVKKKKPKVKPKVKTTCNIKHRDNIYWARNIHQLEAWAGKMGKELQMSNLMGKASATISSYKNCSCSKCKIALQDRNLKRVENFIEESK